MKKLTISKLKKKLWKIFSKFIRLKYSKNGRCQCVTCGQWYPINEIHAGHYIHGNTKPTYFDERNVHPQCVRCNHNLSGNLNQYALYLEGKYGQGILQELNQKAHSRVGFKRQELEDLIPVYKKRLSLLEGIRHTMV